MTKLFVEQPLASPGSANKNTFEAMIIKKCPLKTTHVDQLEQVQLVIIQRL